MKLYLVRHAKSKPDPSLPAAQWQLSEDAYEGLEVLRDELKLKKINCIVTSSEEKAKATAAYLAKQLNIACYEQAGLEEHHRSSTRFMSRERWLETLASFFQKPDECIFGEETANEAKQRFSEAVALAISMYGESIAIVSHGTVLSLFIAEHNKLDVWCVWQSLKMPDLTELNLPSFKLTINKSV